MPAIRTEAVFSTEESVRSWCEGHGPLVKRLQFFSKEEKDPEGVRKAVQRYLDACGIRLPFTTEALVMYW